MNEKQSILKVCESSKHRSYKFTIAMPRYIKLSLISIVFMLVLLVPKNYGKPIKPRLIENIEIDNEPTVLTNEIIKSNIHNCRKCAKNRKLLKSKRILPNFLILGVQKGGTTALYGYLSLHENIMMSCCKEINFFSNEKMFNKGLKHYSSYFPSVPSISRSFEESFSSLVRVGEATPNYIRNPKVARRIYESLDEDIKLIITLRDPVERFISNYIGLVENKNLQLSCQEFFIQQLLELQSCQSFKQPSDDELTTRIEDSCFKEKYNNAISRSVYFFQIEQYLEYFQPSNIKIIQAEFMFTETERILNDVADFLELRSFTRAELEKISNVHQGSQHSKSSLHETCQRSELEIFFLPHKQKVIDLIQKVWPTDILFDQKLWKLS